MPTRTYAFECGQPVRTTRTGDRVYVVFHRGRHPGWQGPPYYWLQDPTTGAPLTDGCDVMSDTRPYPFREEHMVAVSPHEQNLAWRDLPTEVLAQALRDRH